MKIRLGIKNKKDIVTGGIFLLVVVIALQFIYLPKHREVQKLNAGDREVTGEINELYDFIGGRENLQDNIVNMRKKLALLEGTFPFEKEISNIIKELNEKARRFDVNVISVKPKNLEIYKDSDGKELKISDCFCKSMPLTLDVESRYQALGKFIMDLERNRKPMISIKEVNIERDESKPPAVKAKIELSAYILGK